MNIDEDILYGRDSDLAHREIPFICQVFSRIQVHFWLRFTGDEVVCQKYWQIFSGDYWRVGERLSPPAQATENDKRHLTCVVIKKPVLGEGRASRRMITAGIGGD